MVILTVGCRALKRSQITIVGRESIYKYNISKNIYICITDPRAPNETMRCIITLCLAGLLMSGCTIPQEAVKTSAVEGCHESSSSNFSSVNHYPYGQVVYVIKFND